MIQIIIKSNQTVFFSVCFGLKFKIVWFDLKFFLTIFLIWFKKVFWLCQIETGTPVIGADKIRVLEPI